MEFLANNTKAVIGGAPGEHFISAEGKDVIVIGGGDTGTDCVGTSMRHGCRSLIQLEIMPQPPDERAAGNPWPEWPKIRRTDYGQEEAAAAFGADPRRYQVTVKRFLADESGRLSGAEIVDVEWKSVNGRFSPVQVAGSERVLPAQLALLAMGFLGPEDAILDELRAERDERSNAKAEAGSYATSVAKVFAAGDMRRGQSLVVWAIYEGRQAARSVDRFLMGSTDLRG
jgi:glutamate synthase (NADPH/NADH) small chain